MLRVAITAMDLKQRSMRDTVICDEYITIMVFTGTVTAMIASTVNTPLARSF